MPIPAPAVHPSRLRNMVNVAGEYEARTAPPVSASLLRESEYEDPVCDLKKNPAVVVDAAKPKEEDSANHNPDFYDDPSAWDLDKIPESDNSISDDKLNPRRKEKRRLSSSNQNDSSRGNSDDDEESDEEGFIEDELYTSKHDYHTQRKGHLFCAGFPVTWRSSDLLEMFQDWGAFDAKIVERTGKRFGFVDFYNEEKATLARFAMNGKCPEGEEHPIFVTEKTERGSVSHWVRESEVHSSSVPKRRRCM